MSLVSAAFEGRLEWVRRGGEGNLVAYLNRALEAVDVVTRLDGF